MSPRKSGALRGPFNWPATVASSAPPAIGTVPKASPARPDIRPSPPSLHQHRTHQTTTLTAAASTTVTSTHVIDLAPTVLEAAGIPQPTIVNGVLQSPYEGTSMLYSFNDAEAPEQHETQYFEMFCNRGIYHQGWSAVTKHRTPWQMSGQAMPAFDDDVWELYDGNSDWTQSKDLSQENPDKLHELQRLWLIEAVKYNVLPLDDRQIERINPTTAGRPSLIKGNSQLLFAGMGRLSENSVLDIKNKSFAVTSALEVPSGGTQGVIIAQGGRFGVGSRYAKDGRAQFHDNVLGIKAYDIEAPEPIPAGTTQ